MFDVHRSGNRLYFHEFGRKTFFLIPLSFFSLFFPSRPFSSISLTYAVLCWGSIKSQIFNIFRFSYVTSTFSCILLPTRSPDLPTMKVWSVSQITERYSCYVECRHDVSCNRLRCGYYKICGRNGEGIECATFSFIQETILDHQDKNSYFNYLHL